MKKVGAVGKMWKAMIGEEWMTQKQDKGCLR